MKTQIADHQNRQKTLTEQIALAKKLEGKLDNFEAEFKRIKQECAADCKKLSLDVGAIIAAHDRQDRAHAKRDALVAEKARSTRRFSPTEDSSLLGQKAAC